MASGRFEIRTLGKPALPNPISSTERPKYVSQSDRILYDPSIKSVEKAFQAGETPESFEMAGPREHIFFPPARTKAAIVTCGGLCPGINSVIRGLVMQLWYRYQVRNIIGIPYIRRTRIAITLSPRVVDTRTGPYHPRTRRFLPRLLKRHTPCG